MSNIEMTRRALLKTSIALTGRILGLPENPRRQSEEALNLISIEIDKDISSPEQLMTALYDPKLQENLTQGLRLSLEQLYDEGYISDNPDDLATLVVAQKFEGRTIASAYMARLIPTENGRFEQIQVYLPVLFEDENGQLNPTIWPMKIPDKEAFSLLFRNGAIFPIVRSSQEGGWSEIQRQGDGGSRFVAIENIEGSSEPWMVYLPPNNLEGVLKRQAQAKIEGDAIITYNNLPLDENNNYLGGPNGEPIPLNLENIQLDQNGVTIDGVYYPTPDTGGYVDGISTDASDSYGNKGFGISGRILRPLESRTIHDLSLTNPNTGEAVPGYHLEETTVKDYLMGIRLHTGEEVFVIMGIPSDTVLFYPRPGTGELPLLSDTQKFEDAALYPGNRINIGLIPKNRLFDYSISSLDKFLAEQQEINPEYSEAEKVKVILSNTLYQNLDTLHRPSNHSVVYLVPDFIFLYRDELS